MRKIFAFLTALFISTNSCGIILACQPPSLGEIWVITDGGDLFDGAFNQQVLNGSQKFVSDFNKNRKKISVLPNFGYWNNHLLKVKWIISSDSSIATLRRNYLAAAFSGAKTIVCSGFHHIDALTPAIQKKYDGLGVKFILVDADLPEQIDTATLTYASEQSGFLAGLAASIWLVANHNKYPNLQMSAFGAVPAETIIRYMSGYYWGVYYFNHFKALNDDLLTMVDALQSGQTVISKEELVNLKKITFDKLPDSFSHGFDSGSPGVKEITKRLVDKDHNDIIMPVAGAQTSDLINAISQSTSNSNAKIIGVDTDQSVQYPAAKNLFLTSALKGIDKSVSWMLWNSFNLNFNQDQSVSFDQSKAEFFNSKTKSQMLSGKDYIGIANNLAITPIYDQLMGNIKLKTNFLDLAQKVSLAFNLLAQDLAKRSAADKWNDAWINDIVPDSKYQPNF